MVKDKTSGTTYYTATKEPITDEGMQLLEGRAYCKGLMLKARLRIVKGVSRTLMSVSQMTDQGIKVVFQKDLKTQKDTSYIEILETGTRIPLLRKDRVYVIPWHVIDEDPDEEGAEDFPLQDPNP